MTGNPDFWPVLYICSLIVSNILVTLSTVLIWSIIDYKPIGYARKPFPGWAQSVGWTLLMVALSLIPIMAIWTIKHYYCPLKTLKENIKFYFTPSQYWAPHKQENRTGRYIGKKLPHDTDQTGSTRHSNYRPNLSAIRENRYARQPSLQPITKSRNRNNRSDYFDDRPYASMVV